MKGRAAGGLGLALVLALVATPLLGEQADTAAPGRLDFTRALQPGQRSVSVGLRGAEQLDLPTGPRSDLHGGSVTVRLGRCHTRHRERAVELAFARLTGAGETAHVVAVSPLLQREYFHRRPHHTAYWELGVGLSHMNHLVPEQSTHTNFVEHLALGAQWAAGRRGAWGVETRFQHLSNAGREHPNVGLNGLSVGLTYTWYR